MIKKIHHLVTRILIILLVLGMVFISMKSYASGAGPQVTILMDKSPNAPVKHGIDKIIDALKLRNIAFEIVNAIEDSRTNQVIVVGLATGEGDAARLLKNAGHYIPETPEALTIWKTHSRGKRLLVVNGYDDRGLMYALLNIADRISWGKGSTLSIDEVKETTEKPEITERAISIYTMNRAYWESRLYNEAYWARYLDLLSQNRFNSLVVVFGYENGGFLAPCYPYFFNVDGFPDVRMVGLTEAQQQKNLASFNRLISMAHDRGIKFTAGIWDHVYRGGVQGGGIAGTKNAPNQPVPGLVWGVNSDNLIRYNKAALEKFIKLVPGLDAIQFRLHDESGLKKEEQVGFWLDIFRMIKNNYPQMRLDLRAKELPDEVIQGALDLGVHFRIATKYWMEQMGLPYHPTQINPEKSPRRHSYSDLLSYPQQYKMQWRLWNGGTSRILLWGSPEYVRRFAETTHIYDSSGFEVNEPLATKMEAQPHDAPPFDLLNPSYRYYDWEFERYWQFFKTFGRIGYSTNASPDSWEKEFEKRFGSAAAPFIDKALEEASWILPRIVTSCYPYRQFPTTRGWAEMQYMGALADYAKADITDIRQFTNFDEEARIIVEEGETPKMLQSSNSIWFAQAAAKVNKLIMQAEKNIAQNKNKEFVSTIIDLKILSKLALYYSYRIPAAVYYRIFDRTRNVAALDSAVLYESNAVGAWRQIVAAAGDAYSGDIMMGLREADLCGHWRDGLVSLEKGLVNLQRQRDSIKESGSDITKARYKLPFKQLDKHFNIGHRPVTHISVTKPVVITVKATCKSGIKWMRLRYRSMNQEEEYKTLPMVPTAEKDIYQAIVPAEQIESKWDFMYFIELMDNNKSGSIYPDLNVQTPYFVVKIKRP